jgi:hypothetical protein
MDIRRIGSQPSAKGPSDWFKGTVRIDPLFQAHVGNQTALKAFALTPRIGHLHQESHGSPLAL